VTLAAVFMRFNATNREEFRIPFGIVVYLSWTKALISFRQLKFVALRILPITSTMWDVGPFVCVCFVYLLAFVNMYYAMGFYPFHQAFMIMYRLGILGDFDMLALENRGNSMGSKPEVSSMHHVVQLMMIFMTFVMTVTMMNLFIAMLCLSYDKAAQNAETAFLKSRAYTILDLHAMYIGARRLAKIVGCRKSRRRRLSDSGSKASADSSVFAERSVRNLSSRMKQGMALRTPSSDSLELTSSRHCTPGPQSLTEVDKHVWFCSELEFNFT
jgi:hypothetical protein